MLTTRRISKLLLVISLVAIPGIAWAAHNHYYTKVSEIEGENGLVVCQWKCGFGAEEHYATTSGYGYCPQKY